MMKGPGRARAWGRAPRLWLPRLTALLLAMHMVAPTAVEAAPARTNFWDCRPVEDVPELFVRPWIDCCKLEGLMRKPEPVYKTWAQYLADNYQRGLPRRVRPAAHLVAGNHTYLRQLDLAHRLLKALPDSDPRSWTQLTNFHCMYGSYGAARQAGLPDLVYSIHSNWLSFPFHRWFTFFFERTLAKLLGDDTFALPFWNWDNNLEPHDEDSARSYLNVNETSPHMPPNIVPLYYRQPDKYPGLFHDKRDARHMPGKDPVLVDLVWLDVYNRLPAKGPVESAAINRAELKKRLLDSTAGGDFKWFLSHPWRQGDEPVGPPASINTFEGSVHGAIHIWLGSAKHFFLDMGDSTKAANDPLFFPHHTNVDRIWNAWLGLPGHKNYDDPDFLDAAFYFYDENGDIVRVTVAEGLDSDLLNYTYQPVDNPWLPSQQSHDSHPGSILSTSLPEPVSATFEKLFV